MVHAIIGELVTMTVGDSMTIYKPHDSWLWMTCNSTAESCPFAFFNCTLLWFCYEDWCLPWFRFFGYFLRRSVRQSLLKIRFYCYDHRIDNSKNSVILCRPTLHFYQNSKYLHLPGCFHFADLLNTLHSLWQLRFVDDTRLASCFDNCSGFIHAVQVGSPA